MTTAATTVRTDFLTCSAMAPTLTRVRGECHHALPGGLPPVPVTEVTRILGHAKPTTTLSFYAHAIPRDDMIHIDRLTAAREAVRGGNGDFLSQTRRRDCNSQGNNGEPSGDRTRDPLIKSQALYQLS